eukprot:jgi/Botrbrau1/23605/Bobra.55_2s0002.1
MEECGLCRGSFAPSSESHISITCSSCGDTKWHTRCTCNHAKALNSGKNPKARQTEEQALNNPEQLIKNQRCPRTIRGKPCKGKVLCFHNNICAGGPSKPDHQLNGTNSRQWHPFRRDLTCKL